MADLAEKIYVITVRTALGISISGVVLFGVAHVGREGFRETWHHYRETFDVGPKVIVADTNGNDIAEKFIEIGGQRYYSMIDNKPVEPYSYFR